jgi:hypothetical protein
MRTRLAVRDLPVMLLAAALGVATGWLVLTDVELVSIERDWVPGAIVFFAGLLVPFVAALELVPGKPTSFWALVAPLVGAFLVAQYYSFDAYDGRPYYRVSEAGDMPALVVYAAASTALAIGVLTWFRRGVGVALTVPVCLACGVLVFFTRVFH